ncbi:MAG: ABC transporter permease subunit [Lentisphaeria bacterium]|nr:ABC transporter permease subunit [Lentisphaeria bacterium]
MREKKLIRPVPKWKLLLGVAAALAVLYGATLLFSFLVTPDTAPGRERSSAEEIARAEQTRRLPENLDGVRRRVAQPVPGGEYRQSAEFFRRFPGAPAQEIEHWIRGGRLPEWYPRGQSPVLDRAGLPPVAERTGPEPVVMRGAEDGGVFGGVWVQFVAGSGSDAGAATARIFYDRLFRFSPAGYPVVPHIAKGYEMKEEGRVWEVELRDVRWSDGEPFSADDVLYFWNDVMLSKSLGGGRVYKHFTVGGKPATLEKLGRHRVRWRFPEPRADFLETLATQAAFAPRHYLKKYHPDYGDKAFLSSEMEKYNMPNARSLYNLMAGMNPALPALSPWILRKYTTMSPMSFVRNPYYFAVDGQGRQLPYIDRLQLEFIDSMMVPLAVSSGRADMQFRYIRFENYTEFMERSKENGFRVLCWIPGTRSEWMIYPNVNRAESPGDAQSAFKAKLLAEKEFRQALSVALDREQVIRAFYSGLAEPHQVDPGPYSEFPSEKLRHAFTQFDPAEANRKFDAVWRKLGLDPSVRKGGFRCDASGRPVTFYMIFTDFTGIGPAQFVADDWARVGIRCIYQQCSRPLLTVRKSSRNFDFYIWSSESEIVPLLSPRSYVATTSESAYAIGWGNWFSMNGMYGSSQAENPGCIPVPPASPMFRAIECCEEALRSTDPARRKELMNEITGIAAENVWTINLASAPPKLVVVSDNLRGVPEKAVEGYCFLTPGNTAPETYFFAKPSHVADADTLMQLTTPGEIPPASGPPSSAVGRLAQILGGAIAGLLLVLLILKHPFVLRRLVIMVPTLFVISVCIFTIIQLPPGDYLSNRIMQLEESGASPEQIATQIDDLRALFHFDDPAWKRYCRWMGFSYFITFDSKDAGLLQGEMGYSMETSKSVNSMVGDRILLTVLISLGTVLLTWCLALPVGIYSACRQYSAGDYIISVLGFLGMCVPAFLLALILMALTGISGLFSPEYAIQPGWSWGKVADLCRHIWVPILVVGVAGTAGMIRVMRANLLDELRKPYVTTARAKGVRPLKLLFKYPVRIALNPFISGIGTLFPSLVSGSSIVAIVMSLPTVGPLMLSALFSQDMNMAGSMLMVLSLLGVFGTLVSDLLLMLVDPRIRLEGGNTR